MEFEIGEKVQINRGPDAGVTGVVETRGKVGNDFVYAVRLDQIANDGRTLSNALFGEYLQRE